MIFMQIADINREILLITVKLSPFIPRPLLAARPAPLGTQMR